MQAKDRYEVVIANPPFGGKERSEVQQNFHILERSKAAQTSKEARFVRRLGCKTPQTFELYREFVETRPPEVIANIAICLIHQANYLIDQQLKTLEKEIENIVTTTDRLFQFRQADPVTKEASRYGRALLEGFASLAKCPLSTRTAEEICSQIKGADSSGQRNGC